MLRVLLRHLLIYAACIVAPFVALRRLCCCAALRSVVRRNRTRLVNRFDFCRRKKKVGTGNRFSQAYVNLRRDGVPFRGAGGGGDGGGGGLGGFGGGGGGGAFASSNSTARGARGTALRRDHRGAGSTRGLQPGDEGYDEEADLAAAIMASSLSAAGGGGGGGGHGSMDLSAAAGERT